MVARTLDLPGMDYKSLSDDELVRECAAENPSPEAWQEFIRRFQRLIGAVALRACRQWGETAPDVVEDMVQETFLKLYANRAKLKNFQSQHENAFLGYLKVLTANVVYDYFRKIYADVRDPRRTVELNDAIHQFHDSVASMDDTEKKIFFKEVDELLRRRGTGADQEKERAIFWLYYRHGLTAREIASIPGIGMGVKGVESAIHRLTLYVKEELVTAETSTK
jgi:RNA polymerase sigma-70 factor, ECF subfamily